MKFQNTLKYAQNLDVQDPLKEFRDLFYFPKHEHQPVLYFTGNSLGLQPKSAQQYIQQELEDWANYAVEGHFRAKNPWYFYHEMFAKPLSILVGSKPSEVVAMNALSVNLHLLLASFYRPTSKRHRILCEYKAFPSDQYIIESQIQWHGFNPRESVLEVSSSKTEWIQEQDIIETIEKHKDTIALVLLGGVNYYTGQVFDMQKITKIAHKYGIIVGFDLAHAIGNIELKLHDWGVDFAAWCSYKYLNSGPGGVSGIYIHEKHAKNTKLHRLSGWWGYDKKKRFKMEKGFQPIPTAEGWQLSNAPVLSMAAHKASLDIFEKAGMGNLVKKSKLLSSYFEFVLLEAQKNNPHLNFSIITPSGKLNGCQRSIVFKSKGKLVFDYLTKHGVVADWREPNVMRFAPVPLYNSFLDIYRLGQILMKYS